MAMTKAKRQAKSNERMKAAGYSLVASWVPKADAEAAQAIAERETISVACVMRYALRDFLEKMGPQPPKGKRLIDIL